MEENPKGTIPWRQCDANRVWKRRKERYEDGTDLPTASHPSTLHHPARRCDAETALEAQDRPCPPCKPLQEQYHIDVIQPAQLRNKRMLLVYKVTI